MPIHFAQNLRCLLKKTQLSKKIPETIFTGASACLAKAATAILNSDQHCKKLHQIISSIYTKLDLGKNQSFNYFKNKNQLLKI